MNIKKIIFVSVLMSSSWMSYAQQDPLYSQNQFNQSMINPAYTGVNNVLNATVIARRQWVGLEGSPETNILNVSTSLLNNKLGLGLIALDDRYGVNKNTEIQLLYAYRIDLLNGKSFSFGLQTGYINYTYDYSQLTLEQNDQALDFADGNVSKFNVGTGVYYRSNKFYLGFSVPKLIETKVDQNGSTSTLSRRHYYFSTGYVFDQLIALKFKPSILIKAVEGQPLSIDFNASVLLLETLWVGASIRNFNAVGINSQFELINKIRLGYSFELPLNDLSNNAFSTHELMLSLDLEIFNNHAIGKRYF